MKNNNNKPEKKSKDFTGVKRAAYIVAFACMLAIGAYFFIMVSNPDVAQKVLGAFGIASAIHYFVLAVK